MLEFKKLSAGYNKSPLQKPFSLKIKEGEIVVLIGSNGAGKSTLLKTIIREIPAVGGSVFFDGKAAPEISLKEFSKSVSALLTLSVRPELMTCRDVVASGRYPHTGRFGILSAADFQAVDEAIHIVQGEAFAQKKFSCVSDGQKQRILFARALCQNPKVLVLDEPTSYLDVKWRLELLKILRELSGRGMTIIASMHELDLSLRLADRILCVGKSEIRELSREENECRKQILDLYDLDKNFFIEEKAYEELVQKFCGKKIFEKSPQGCGTAASKQELHGRNSCLMVQGTMSNAGKSFVVAGLCRIFKQDGFSVAPFKSQNMALNSFVTKEGLEMGRAQVMQAEAAGVELSVFMNPILLKPSSDVGSQVIVNGEVLGNMSARDYFSFKKQLVPCIKAAYERLSNEHEIIVIEGAGSPAEINLKENDIVNMGMARIADSPVILVADIDRGGVFAQILGTVELLDDEEKKRIKGFVINKFRGDPSLLTSGIKIIEEKTGVPCLGTLPYIRIQLDDEDSLSTNLHMLTRYKQDDGKIQIATVRLPHISNFTDFIPLQNSPLVNLYYVSEPKDLGCPDCIILPGTKNTLADLDWLQKSGLAAMIQSEAKKSKPVIGICGGFQMLGEKISGSEQSDVRDEESGIRNEELAVTVAGLGLLPVETEFSSEKTRTRVSGKLKGENGKQKIDDSSDGEIGCSESGGLPCCGRLASESLFSALGSLPVSGYEIHMGRTRFVEGVAESFLAQVTDSVSGEAKLDGAVSGNVFGTYIHGFFDQAELCQKFIEILARRKGIDFEKAQLAAKENLGGEGKSQIFNGFPTIQDFKESQYNLLAEALRAHLDMKKIYEILSCS